MSLVARSGRREASFMLWTIVVLLLILWLLGFTMHVAGGLIHVLLVIALVVVVLRLLSGRRVV
jgi:hypothetical protein